MPSWIPNPFKNNTTAEEMKLLNAQRTGTGIPLNGKNAIKAQQTVENKTAASAAMNAKLASSMAEVKGSHMGGRRKTRNSRKHNRKHNRKTNKKHRS